MLVFHLYTAFYRSKKKKSFVVCVHFAFMCVIWGDNFHFSMQEYMFLLYDQ